MKSKNKKLATPYERARKRVEDIKGFYGHLAVYIIVNAVLLLSKGNVRFMLINDTVFDGVNFLEWINWNVYGTPIVWGIFLVFHALNVFGKNPFLGKAWEERQIEKYMDRDKSETL